MNWFPITNHKRLHYDNRFIHVGNIHGRHMRSWQKIVWFKRLSNRQRSNFACSINPPFERCLRFNPEECHTDDVALQRQPTPTTQQPTRNTACISVELHHRYVIFGLNFRQHLLGKYWAREERCLHHSPVPKWQKSYLLRCSNSKASTGRVVMNGWQWTEWNINA